MNTDVAASYCRDQLFPCEKELIRQVVEGNSNRAIASQLNSAEAAVQVQLKCLLTKIRVTNRTEATIWVLANLPELMAKVLAQTQSKRGPCSSGSGLS